MSAFARYDASVAFLRDLDDDWAGLVAHVGPCLHDPKAAREPYDALVRAIGYQQLTAKAGDAIIARLKALYPSIPTPPSRHPDTTFPTPENIMVAEFDALRACGFSATKIATIKAIAKGTLSGLIPPRNVAGTMDGEELIARRDDQGHRPLDRRDAAHVSAGAHGHSAGHDFGVREGYRSLKSLPEQPKPNALREIGKAWAPHRTVAAWYLWRMPR